MLVSEAKEEAKRLGESMGHCMKYEICNALCESEEDRELLRFRVLCACVDLCGYVCM